MKNNNGYIKLHRELLQKAIWKTSTPEQKAVLMSILMSVNHKSAQWEWQGRKFEIIPGQMITSLRSLAEIAGVSIQNVRSALARFKKLDFLTEKSTKTGRVITVVNWSVYQSQAMVPSKEVNNDPTKTQQLTRIIECLNSIAGRSFETTSKSAQKHIAARLNEGFSFEHFQAVIEYKFSEWGNDPKYFQYLRPQTLFGNNFEGYLQAAKSSAQLQSVREDLPSYE